MAIYLFKVFAKLQESQWGFAVLKFLEVGPLQKKKKKKHKHKHKHKHKIFKGFIFPKFNA